MPTSSVVAEFTPRNRLKLVAIHTGVSNARERNGREEMARKICEEVMSEFVESSQKNHKPLTCGNKLCQQLKTHSSQQQTDSPTPPAGQVSAETAVVRLIEKMENIRHFNCGYGSNLNINCQVECDAGFMCDKTQYWAGVGAVSGCKNPILLTKSLYDHRTVARPLDLIQPNLLVGTGARQFMRDHCPGLAIQDSRMISSEALSRYQKFKSKYDSSARLMLASGIGGRQQVSAESKTCNQTNQNQTPRQSCTTSLDHGSYCLLPNSNQRTKLSGCRDEQDECPASDHPYSRSSSSDQAADCDKLAADPNECRVREALGIINFDTVGATVVDCDNNFASAISSGGLLLKYKGRLGQAAIPGAGCWAESSIAVTTTGVGEYLTTSMFAKKFHDKMSTLRLLHELGHIAPDEIDFSDLINGVIGNCFEDLLRSPGLDHVPLSERSAGLLQVSSLRALNSTASSPAVSSSASATQDADVYLSFAHNTKSMCIGYMTCEDTVGHSIMSSSGIDRDTDSIMIRTMKFNLPSIGSGW